MSEDLQLEKFRAAAESGNAAAQFNMGLWHMRSAGAGPLPVQALDWFERAANKDFAPAQTMMGRINLGQNGNGRDTEAARAWFRKAASQGFAEASYQLAELCVAAGDSSGHYEEARRWLEKAATDSHALAICQLAYLLDEGIGGPADPVRAVRLNQSAARLGVPRAWNQLGRCFETGHGFTVDPARAVLAYRQAAAKNYPGAGRLAQRIAGALGENAPAVADDRSAMALTEIAPDERHIFVRPGCTPEVLSESPRIAVLHQLFSPTECQHLIAISRPHLRPSQVVSKEGINVQHDMRTSWEMRFAPESKDMLVNIYERRLAKLSNTRTEQGEPLLILRYQPGQEYRTHVDYLDPLLPGQKKVIDENGQRMLTMLTYLCEVDAGGGTEFPKLGITVSPEQGSTLAFYNVTPDGQPDPDTKHAGLPVQAGVKWLATRWIRDRDWTPVRV